MDFVGSDKVIIRAGTVNYPISFNFSPCTSDTANDGSIPFDTVIESAEIIVQAKDKTDITEIVGGSAIVVEIVDGLRVNAEFDFPPDTRKGVCVVLIALTLNIGSVLVKRWDGLTIENL